jgi:regulator of protease activity HflC (stomatin/prohibitin superfamily)
MKNVFLILTISLTLFSCSRVEPNYEGVLMENYGRNGKSDFQLVKGKQWTISPGTQLYQVPMFETSGDADEIIIRAKDAGKFSVNPVYQYQPIRGKGIDIVFNYKHLGVDEPEVMLENIEKTILNRLVVDAYRVQARNYTTDSLMNNLNTYEQEVQAKLKEVFKNKYFQLNELTSGLTPPESMSKAIEARNNAVQEANKVENELRVARMELEKAKIDAETNKAKAEGLDSKILTARWIDAIRYSKNKVIITDGKTPVIIQ